MKKTLVRITALMLALLMIFPLGTFSYAAGEEKAGDEFFALTVIFDGDYIVAPEKVFYQPGDTIRDALRNSSHTFEGIDSGGFITSVDGQGDSFSLFYDDMAYDLDFPAETVETALMFTNGGETAYSPEALELVHLLAVHQDLPDAEKTYPPVASAYVAAYEGLKTCDGQGAAPLLEALTAAYADYDAWSSSEGTRVDFNVTMGGAATDGFVIEAVDANGYAYTSGEGESFLLLKPGDYTYKVVKENRIFTGTLSIPRETRQMTVDAPLPAGNWLSAVEFRLTNASSSPTLKLEAGGADYVKNLYVPDDADRVYPYMTPGDEVGDTPAAYEPYFTSDLGRTQKRAWKSYSTTATGLFDMGCENSRITLEVVHPMDNGSSQMELFHFDLIRVPEIKSLSVAEDNGSSPTFAFDRNVKEYDISVTSDYITVSASAEYLVDGVPYGTAAEGYKLYVDGTDVTAPGKLRLPVSDGSVVTLRSEGPNGASDQITLNVIKIASVAVTVNHPAGTEVTLVSENGSVISPNSDNGQSAIFSVAPGQYQWDAVLDEHYHSLGAFTVGDEPATVTAVTPVKETLLTGLGVKSGSTNTAKVYDLAEPFDPENHEITVLTPDVTATFFIFPEKVDGATVTREGYMGTNGKWKEPTEVTGKYASCAYFVARGGRNNSLVLKVSRADGNVVYYQDYIVSTSRVASIKTMSCTTPEGATAPLYLVEGGEVTESTTFDPDKYTYHVAVSEALERLVFDIGLEPGCVKNSDYTVTVGDETVLSSEAGSNFTITVQLDPEEAFETIEIKVSVAGEGNTDSTYTIEVEKLEPVYLTINATPEGSLVSLMNDLTGDRVKPGEDGRFQILPATDYTYTVTKKGYIGATGKVKITGDSLIEVELQEAPENTSLNTDLSEEWPRFRFDENNNGVTDYPLPYNQNDVALYWANKVGDGYGAQATGCPIMAGGYIYTYASKTIVKIDPLTGKAVASGEMAESSSFAINSPTYAEGMIFVAQSSGGVQAFNAETLESLWVYKDPMGGQPNCPIAYCDGYIYTGFWVGESKKANFVCLSVTDEDPTTGTEEKVASWTVRDNGFYWAGAYVGPANYGTETDGKTYIVVGTEAERDGDPTAGANLLSIDQESGAVIDKIASVCSDDIRSSICFDTATGRFFFTSKGGWFCSILINEDGTFDRDSFRKIYLTNGAENPSRPPMSTSTPCVYNGRAYIGVSGTGQFADYSGHNITVIDIESNTIAYTVPTQGYPQTSGLVTTAWGQEDGSVYVYFFDNATPGILRVLKDKPGQTAPDRTVTESDSYGNTHEVGYSLFTPYGKQAQYAICSPIADEYGNIYFKNDSAYMMMIGPTIDELRVTKNPDKTEYESGEIFDPTGMEITAYYSNGTSRVIPAENLAVPSDPLTADDTEINIRLDLGEYMQTYQDKDGVPGTAYVPPMAAVAIKVDGGSDPTDIHIVRLAGKSRYDTAITAAEHVREKMHKDSFDALIIAGGTDFPDALSASYLAYRKDAPILLVGKDAASIAKVTEYVNTYLSAEGTVYIVGGKGAVPEEVENAITSGSVQRLSGKNRYLTNLAVLEEAGAGGKDLIVASGAGFADALSASAVKRPILLVGGTSLTEEQKTYLTDNADDLGGTVYIAGGKGAVSLEIEDQLNAYGTVNRLAGSNRYDTSVKIAMEFFEMDLDTVVIASGAGFPDGLSGGPVAIYYDAPLLLVANGYAENVKAIFHNSAAYRLVVMGGKGAVSKEIAEYIADPAKEEE